MCKCRWSVRLPFGVRALLVGGNVNNGRNAGARYCNVNNSPGNANWNIGAAQSCFSFIGTFFPMPQHPKG